MKTYTNNGSKKGNKPYLVVGGKRVYTGQDFEAKDTDIEKLKKNFNVKPKDSKKAVEKKQPADKPAKTETKAEDVVEDTNSDDFGFLKTTNSDKGVK